MYVCNCNGIRERQVRAAIAAGAREGRIQSGSTLTVFESLVSTGWLLAVTVDGAPYGLQ